VTIAGHHSMDPDGGNGLPVFCKPVEHEFRY